MFSNFYNRRLATLGSVLTLLAAITFPLAPAAAQDQTFEAESAKKIGRGTRSRQLSGASGGRFLDYGGARSYAEWRITANEGGPYSLTVKYRNGDTTPRPLALSVNGTRASTDGTAFPPTGAWTQWDNVVIAVQLKKGTNVIRMTALGKGPDLDLLTLRGGGTAPSPTPPAATPTPTHPPRPGDGHSSVPDDNFTYRVTRGTSALGSFGTSASRDQENKLRLFCHVSHFAYTDPIVFPGQKAATHLHMFFGNTTTNESSTRESLMSAATSSCKGGILNRSAYWVPAMHNARGEVIMPQQVLVYYKISDDHRGNIKPIPDGVRLLTGNPKATADAPQHHNNHSLNFLSAFGADCSWGQGEGVRLPETCRNNSENAAVTMWIRFPSCLAINQQGEPILDSPDHSSHARHIHYNSRCPASHPYQIPQVEVIVTYGVTDETGQPGSWYLSSDMYDHRTKGGGYSLHADWMEAWDSDTKKTLVDNLNRGNYLSVSDGSTDGRKEYHTGATLYKDEWASYNLSRYSAVLTETPGMAKGGAALSLPSMLHHGGHK